MVGNKERRRESVFRPFKGDYIGAKQKLIRSLTKSFGARQAHTLAGAHTLVCISRTLTHILTHHILVLAVF